MAKTKEIKLPKYLKLAKGTMWMDIEGDKSSGIRLYNVDKQFLGRGYITNQEHENYLKEGIVANKPVPKDLNDNKDSTDGSYGYAKLKDDKSWFCVNDVPPERRSNIINAYNAGVLESYNPNKKIKEVVTTKQNRTFKVNRDGDLVFDGGNQEMYKKLNKLSVAKLIEFINSCTEKSKTNLMDLLQYESKSLNPLSRPRGKVLKALRNKLDSLSPGISPVSVNDFDDKDEDSK